MVVYRAFPIIIFITIPFLVMRFSLLTYFQLSLLSIGLSLAYFDKSLAFIIISD